MTQLFAGKDFGGSVIELKISGFIDPMGLTR